MAIEDVPGSMKPYARPFNLVPPPRDRQFRTATLKAERSQRKADRRLAAALDEGEAEAVHAVNTAELARLWGSAAYRDLRAGLPPQEEEKLHRQLVGVLAGETPLAVWHATIASLRAARRAADLAADARPRKWRQAFPDLNGW
jgi:hypothetical protein